MAVDRAVAKAVIRMHPTTAADADGTAPDQDGTADPLARIDLPSLLVDEFPECPRCGGPVVQITMTGPTERFATPCGCRLGDGLELT